MGDLLCFHKHTFLFNFIRYKKTKQKQSYLGREQKKKRDKMVERDCVLINEHNNGVSVARKK